ncbi:hypothetical protein GQ53DRAFT_339844 [Thozetella sp. PMI_491]|nr:hypothetical protein GQ53DRAFT_339844 [Thozetella sp. PMI_491]
MASRDNQESPPLSRDEDRERHVKYHVYVRLPFKRGDFIDPPPFDWDESKSEALWGIISVVAHTEIDWDELAARFNVTLEFILQMASYLTERKSSQIRAQMRKATTTKGSAAPSPVPGSEGPALAAAHGALAIAASEAMRRTGSGGGRAPSSLSIRKDSPLPKNDGSTPGTPVKTSLALRPQVSRNSSAGTTVPTNTGPAGPKAGGVGGVRETNRRRLSSLTIATTPAQEDASVPEDADNEAPSPGPASEGDGDSDSSESPVESRIIRRPPRFHANDGAGDYADDDDEAEPAFLPFSARHPTGSGQGTQDLGATLRGDPHSFGRRLASKEPAQHSQTSDSSASSAALVSKPGTVEDRKPGAGPGPLSPRRTTELAGKGKGKGYSREGSDGTPSMGSSFSDLDDASVTQSALEEALASKMQDGTIGSRMSTIGAALRSRYLPQNRERQQQ